ncbi:helix-turn-helix domain-containing protein [Mariluticola halotolerans]|uniref:helix-turn-helix domain-containing protein n=1 Tax=Mariluticola halotolerans TaxID=2909283 RepID=UPI0026E47D9B|nr:helix-turn-helix domain-containing protein [Mariluticola halotolerans]UJQ94880.1 helix-turn-helix domain-containing protein [Mariluticola halotolerans]
MLDAPKEVVTAKEGALSAPGKNLRSSIIESAAAQAAMQPWVAMECYQLSRGKQVSLMDSLDLGRVQIVREHQFATIQKLGTTPTDFCTISYCTHDPAFRLSDHASNSADSVFFIPESTEFDIHVPAGTQTAYVSFSQSEFVGAARVLNPRAWERPSQRVLQFQSTQLTELKSAIGCWLGTAEAAAKRGETLDPAVMRGIVLQTALRTATAHSVDGKISAPLAARTRAVRICRLARDFVEEQLANHAVPTVVDICMTLAVSERALLYAFHDYVGMSPQAYLRRCRLNQVRATLLARSPQNTTVTQVAMQFGFLHLGRFAGDYKQIFEESPAATLKRCM